MSVSMLPCSSCPGNLLHKSILSNTSNAQLKTSPVPFHEGSYVHKKKAGLGLHVLSPNIMSAALSTTVELLDSWDDEYDGVIINPESLPSTANVFASSLRASLSNWKLKVGILVN